MRSKTVFFLAILAIVLATTGAVAQNKVTLSDIKNSLICQCECGMTVEACEGSMACSVASRLTEEARNMIIAGQDKEQILAAFVAKYGEKVLSAPTKKGFNLTAWIMPFLVLFLTAGVIVRVVQRWAAREQQAAPKRTTASSAAELKYEKTLDDVLRQLD